MKTLSKIFRLSSLMIVFGCLLGQHSFAAVSRTAAVPRTKDNTVFEKRSAEARAMGMFGLALHGIIGEHIVHEALPVESEALTVRLQPLIDSYRTILGQAKNGENEALRRVFNMRTPLYIPSGDDAQSYKYLRKGGPCAVLIATLREIIDGISAEYTGSVSHRANPYARAFFNELEQCRLFMTILQQRTEPPFRDIFTDAFVVVFATILCNTCIHDAPIDARADEVGDGDAEVGDGDADVRVPVLEALMRLPDQVRQHGNLCRALALVGALLLPVFGRVVDPELFRAMQDPACKVTYLVLFYGLEATVYCIGKCCRIF